MEESIHVIFDEEVLGGNQVKDKEQSSLQFEEDFSLNEVAPEETINDPLIVPTRDSQDPSEAKYADNRDTKEETQGQEDQPPKEKHEPEKESALGEHPEKTAVNNNPQEDSQLIVVPYRSSRPKVSSR